jgi:hypothetical protein
LLIAFNGQRTIGGPLVIPFLKNGPGVCPALVYDPGALFAGRIINKGRCYCGAGLVCNSQFIEKGKIMKKTIAAFLLAGLVCFCVLLGALSIAYHAGAAFALDQAGGVVTRALLHKNRLERAGGVVCLACELKLQCDTDQECMALHGHDM